MLKVLDAWAVLAWLQDERPAADKVQGMLDKAAAGNLQLRMRELLDLTRARSARYSKLNIEILRLIEQLRAKE